MIPARVRPTRPAIAAAVTFTALISGAGVALAATSSSSAPRTPSKVGAAVATASASSSSSRCKIKLPLRGLFLPGTKFAIPGPPVPFGFGPFGFKPFGFGPLGAIHGQFVAPKQGGGYQTIDTQRGTVTAVSSSSLTVRSSDGYANTYQVTSSTYVNAQRAGIGTVKTGQTVAVLATVHGSSATATQIVDFAALPRMPQIPAKTRQVLPELPEILKPGSGHMIRIGPCAFSSTSR